MHYLITGAGMIGAALADALKDEHDLVLLDVARPDRTLPGRFVLGDIRDPDTALAAAEGMDGIFHTAALHGIHLGSHTPSEFMEINVQGTFHVLEAARLAGVRRVVHSSTVGVFGSGLRPRSPGLPAVLDDDTPRLPSDDYGMTKLLCEHMCAYYRRAKGVETVALRYGAIRQLVRRLLEGPVDAGWALGGILTDLQDAVSANLAAMARSELTAREAYTILPTTLLDAGALDLAEGDLRAALVASLPGLSDHDLPSDVAVRVLYDSSGAERDLGFRIESGQDEFLREALGG